MPCRDLRVIMFRGMCWSVGAQLRQHELSHVSLVAPVLCTMWWHYMCFVHVQQLGELHFLDAGLNCRGAHLTDPQVLQSLSKAMQDTAPGLSIHLHGTPRQWGKLYMAGMTGQCTAFP